MPVWIILDDVFMYHLSFGSKSRTEAPEKEVGTRPTQISCQHALSIPKLEPLPSQEIVMANCEHLSCPGRVSHLLLTPGPQSWRWWCFYDSPHPPPDKPLNLLFSRLGSQLAGLCSSKFISTNMIRENGRAAQAVAQLPLVVFDETKFQDVRTISRSVYFRGPLPASAQRRKPERRSPNQTESWEYPSIVVHSEWGCA